MDELGFELAAYNPKRKNRNGKVHKLRANEELIGVYGVYLEKKSFSAFGLIVKVVNDHVFV